MVEQAPSDPQAPTDGVAQDPYRLSIYQKVDNAWGSNIGGRGYADPNEVAARFYDSLYRPQELEVNMDSRAPDVASDRPPSRLLKPSTRAALLAPLELQGRAPSADEFVAAVSGAILLEADVASTVLPGAREQLVKLIATGDRPAIWSAGHPEHQYRKLGKAGLYDAIAFANIEPPVEITGVHGEPIEVSTAIAVDKTTPQTFARVRAIAGTDQIAVVEDRVRNLYKFSAHIPETKAAVWVQHGAHAKKEVEDLAKGDNAVLAEAIATGAVAAIPSIDQLDATIARLRDRGILTGRPAAVFFDFDDTLSDNARRRALELTAVVDKLFRYGWV